MSKGIQITFELNPPPESSVPPLQSYEFPLATDSQEALNSAGYYQSLRDAIASAKARTGQDLTTYRDMAADYEKHKAPAVKPSSDDEEEEAEE
jgi:hypothetical protein